MATYSYTDGTVEAMVAKRRKFAGRFLCVTVPLLVALWWSLFQFHEFWSGHLDVAFIPIQTVLLLGILNTGWPYKKKFRDYEQGLRATWVTIAPGNLTMSMGGKAPVQVDLKEIVRGEERDWNGVLLLRTSQRYRSYWIPRNLEDYQLLRMELSGNGIAIYQTQSLPNWEEFAAVLGFSVAMLCVGYSRSFWVLGTSVLVLLLFAIFCYIVLRANPHVPPSRRWMRFTMFAFVIPAAIVFWIAFMRS